MSDELTQNEQQQLINRLMRSGDGLTENAFVTSAGGKVTGFVAKVISNYDCNHYYVKPATINPCGFPPSTIGGQVIAINVAEDFTEAGTLAAGTYVIMFKIGEYYCFYAIP